MAVDLLRAETATDTAARTAFDRAARLAARVSHPAVVCAYDRGLDGMRPYLVTELPRGVAADALEAWLPPHRVAALGRDLAEGLAAVHAAGAPHGGIDASRVLLDGDRVRLDRIGIAALSQPSATKADDVADLAAVLYRLLSGNPPEGPEPLPARTVRPAVPAALDTVVLDAMAGRCADAATLAGRLAALELDDDAARELLEPTPPHGSAPAHAPRRAPSADSIRRDWVGPTLAMVAGAVAVAVLAVAIVRAVNVPGETPATEPAPADGSVTAANATSFDPFGPDGAENEERAALAVDGDRATAWATDRYASASFGNLKPGVGLVVNLGDTTRVSGVDLEAPTTGWTGEIYAGTGEVPADLAGWGAPVQTFTAGTATVTIAVEATATRILVWITELGPDRRVEIAEATVRPG